MAQLRQKRLHGEDVDAPIHRQIEHRLLPEGCSPPALQLKVSERGEGEGKRESDLQLRILLLVVPPQQLVPPV